MRYVWAYAIAATWFSVCIAAGLALRGAPADAALGRFIVFLAILAAVTISLPGVIPYLYSFGRGQRVAIAILSGLLLMSQMKMRDAALFPFASWYMFTELEGDPKHYDELKIWGYMDSGERVPIRYKIDNPGLLLTTVMCLDDLYGRLQNNPSSADKDKFTQRIHQTLQALARRHNALHPDKPIVEVAFEKTPMTIEWRDRKLMRGKAAAWREKVAVEVP